MLDAPQPHRRETDRSDVPGRGSRGRPYRPGQRRGRHSRASLRPDAHSVFEVAVPRLGELEDQQPFLANLRAHSEAVVHPDQDPLSSAQGQV